MPETADHLKKVLFVDDNLQFLEMIERVMGAWSKGEWQIFLAQNTGKALLILQEHAIDLAVVDIQMPVVDGIQFLAMLNRKYPGIMKVTLSAYADAASRTACLNHGAELFLEKPRNPGDLEIIFSTLRELAKQKPTTSGFRGVLRQVSLEDVIQMECLNRNSSVLEVVAGKLTGKIYVKDGAIIHAEVGDRNGEAGLNKILALKGGDFNLKPFTEPPLQSIDGSWEFLLMEAARARDEASEASNAGHTEFVEPAVDMPVPAPPVQSHVLPPEPTEETPQETAETPVEAAAPEAEMPLAEEAAEPSLPISEEPSESPLTPPEAASPAPMPAPLPPGTTPPPRRQQTPAKTGPPIQLFVPTPEAPMQPFVPVKTPATPSGAPPLPALKPGAAGKDAGRPARVDEMVVCSPKGEVLYEWKSTKAQDRVSFLEFLSQKSTQLGEGLSLGTFDRLEMESDTQRVIAQVKSDRGIFLLVAKGAALRDT